MNTNTICHYLSPDGIRLTIADTSKAAKEAETLHHLPEASAVILAKVMTGAAMIANDFKNHEGVTFKWVTGSPLGEIHADAYDGHFVRGYIEHPEAGIDKSCIPEDEAALVSKHARLFVTRYSLLKLPYTSAVPLSPGDISACLTEYLNTSEQTLSAIKLSTQIDESGKIIASIGFLAQLMPDGNLPVFAGYFKDLTYWNLHDSVNSIHSLETLVTKGEFQLLSKGSLNFGCTCSEARIRSAVTALPISEQEELLRDPFIETVCHYCGKKYIISREMLKKWFADKEKEKIQ